MRLTLVLAALWGLMMLGFVASDYDQLKTTYPSHRSALAYAIEHNDFAAAFASPEDIAFFAHEFAWVKELPTERDRLLALIEWSNTNIAEREVFSVRAKDIYEERAGACEVHALVVALARAVGIRARWISNVAASPGFGWLEAYVDGEWRLFRLRHTKPELGASAWQAKQGETNAAIRLFYDRPGQNTRSYAGTVMPSLFMLENAIEEPRYQKLFHSEDGVAVDFDALRPLDMLVGFRTEADGEWTTERTLAQKFRWIRTSGPVRWNKVVAWFIRTFGDSPHDADPMARAWLNAT